MSIQLRVITPDDWEELRTIRLRALADSPDAFGATLADASAHAEEVWRSRAGGPGPVVLAWAGDGPALAMGGLYLPDGSTEAFVWGMWVDPASRGLGLAGRILERLLEHADAAGRPVVLHVTEGNDTARRLYERHGFTSTGETQPLREGSEVHVHTMRLA